MWNIFVVIALTAGGLSLSIASTVEAIPLSSQDAQQEFLNRRVTDLEEALEQLRNEYGARLATIEAEIAQLRDVQLGTTPDVAVTAEEGAAEVVGETMSGKSPDAGGSAYAAAKFGLRGFAQSLLYDVRRSNVRVMVVNPSATATGADEGPPHGPGIYLHAADIAATLVHLARLPGRTLFRDMDVWGTNPFPAGE